MFTRKSRSWLTALVVVGFASLAAAQALTPAEIKDPHLRDLQEKYLKQLQTVGVEVQGHIFPFPFLFQPRS